MSVAGLAGLVSAFRRGDTWDRVELWRLRNIAQLSFIAVFLSLAIFPIHSLLGDEATAIRCISGAIAIIYIIEIVLARRDRLNWPTADWLVAFAAQGTVALLNAANVALGLTGLLEVGLLLRLLHPIHLFILTLGSFDPTVREP